MENQELKELQEKNNQQVSSALRNLDSALNHLSTSLEIKPLENI